jgi:hypothetical protein
VSPTNIPDQVIARMASLHKEDVYAVNTVIKEDLQRLAGPAPLLTTSSDRLSEQRPFYLRNEVAAELTKYLAELTTFAQPGKSSPQQEMVSRALAASTAVESKPMLKRLSERGLLTETQKLIDAALPSNRAEGRSSVFAGMKAQLRTTIERLRLSAVQPGSLQPQRQVNPSHEPSPNAKLAERFRDAADSLGAAPHDEGRRAAGLGRALADFVDGPSSADRVAAALSGSRPAAQTNSGTGDQQGARRSDQGPSTQVVRGTTASNTSPPRAHRR